jgi:hypothetical protein
MTWRAGRLLTEGQRHVRRYSSGPPVAPFIGFVLVAFLVAIVLPYMLTH